MTMARPEGPVRASRIEPREYRPPNVYHHKTVETMSDREIRNNVCRNVTGGCRECEVLRSCRYGEEYLRRKDAKQANSKRGIKP